MKKLRKTLMILSSVMVISACAISPISAEEVTEPVESEQTEEKITEPNYEVVITQLGVDEYIHLSFDERIAKLKADGLYDDEDVGFEAPGEKIIDGVVYIIDEELNEAYYDACFGRSNSNNNDNTVNHKFNSATTLNVRDAAFIARSLATGAKDLINEYPDADYNKDGVVSIRDAAAIAKDLATRN